jgi:hypothetical protein
MYELAVALVLSPGNKAQTKKDGILFVVCEHEGVFEEMTGDQIGTSRLISVKNGKVEHDEIYKHYKDFRSDLESFGLDPHAPIWYSIGYTPIP